MTTVEFLIEAAMRAAEKSAPLVQHSIETDSVWAEKVARGNQTAWKAAQALLDNAPEHVKQALRDADNAAPTNPHLDL